MTNINCPKILPLPEGVNRPLWSVMIPTYNCAGYLRKSLESVLSQDLDSDVMQIMVVDNNSTADDPEAMVKELGQGRVEFYRQSQNIGPIRNFNTCLGLARGKLVHLLYADDYVLEGFYSKMQALFQAYPAIGAAFCRITTVDECENFLYLWGLELPENGFLPDTWLERLATFSTGISSPAMVVRREVYESLGGFDLRLVGPADWELWTRIATHFPIGYEVNTLVCGRFHSKSLSQEILSSECLIQDYFKAIQIMQSYLPQAIKQKVFRQARQNCALRSLSPAQSLVDRDKWMLAIKILLLSLWMSPSYLVIRSVSRMLLINIPHTLLESLFNKLQKQVKMGGIS